MADGATTDARRTSGPVPLRVAIVVLLLVVLAGIGIGIALSSGGSSTWPIGPEGVTIQEVPNLAPASSTAPGSPVDGMTCRGSNDQVVNYHIHVMLNIYVQGKRVRVPAGVGIPSPQFVEHLSTGIFIDNGLIGGCLYWLHVHAYDGIIHVESPYRHTFTLGQFFDVWRQPLSSTQVGPARGMVTAFENGRRIAGSPRAIPLLRQAVIQLDVGTPVVPFRQTTFVVNGLCGEKKKTCTSKG